MVRRAMGEKRGADDLTPHKRGPSKLEDPEEGVEEM